MRQWQDLTNCCIAKGNQRFEGVHQDHEKREEVPSSRRKDHNQEEQEEQHYQAEATHSSLPAHSLGWRQVKGWKNHAEYPTNSQERPPWLQQKVNQTEPSMTSSHWSWMLQLGAEVTSRCSVMAWAIRTRMACRGEGVIYQRSVPWMSSRAEECQWLVLQHLVQALGLFQSNLLLTIANSSNRLVK